MKMRLTGHQNSRKLAMAPTEERKGKIFNSQSPNLGGEPLMDDASIRDFNGGIGCHVASTLEETLLLPRDMVEL